MNVPSGVGCFGGDHRAGAQPGRVVLRRLARVAPDLVNARHNEQTTVGPMNEERLLAWLASAASAGLLFSCVPLIEAVRRQDAAAGAKGTPERRLLRHCFEPSIDHSRADRSVLRPRRNQPPNQRSEPPPYLAGVFYSALEDGRHRHCWGNV